MSHNIEIHVCLFVTKRCSDGLHKNRKFCSNINKCIQIKRNSYLFNQVSSSQGDYGCVIRRTFHSLFRKLTPLFCGSVNCCVAVQLCGANLCTQNDILCISACNENAVNCTIFVKREIRTHFFSMTDRKQEHKEIERASA